MNGLSSNQLQAGTNVTRLPKLQPPACVESENDSYGPVIKRLIFVTMVPCATDALSCCGFPLAGKLALAQEL